jgi:foldase protein PrsA
MTLSQVRLAGFFAALSLTVSLTVSSTGAVFAQNSASQKPIPAKPPTTKPAPKPEPQLPPNVMAKVGSQTITRDDLIALFAMFNGQPILDQAIQASLIEQEAKRLGVSVSDTELKEGIKETQDRVVQQQMMSGTPMTYAEIAAREGFSAELLRWSVRLQILRRKAFSKSMESKVPNRDTQVKLAHILLATMPLPTNPTEQPKPLTPEERKIKEESAKKKIDELYADLKAGKITWEDAVKQSEDPSSAINKGELDFYGKGVLDPNFEQAGFALEKPGDIVGPVKSQFGWHIIKLIQKGSDLPAADKEAYKKQQLEMLMSNPQAVQAWVNGLRDSKTVTINRKAQIVPTTPMTKPNAKPTPKKTSQKPRSKSE